MTKNINLAYYLAFVEVGHCGNGYFIPALFPIKASSIEEAKQIARDIPRVKHDKKHAIIFCRECSYHEYKITKYINDFNPFLTSDEINGSHESIRQSRVRSPLYIEDLEKEIRRKNSEALIDEYTQIKTADKFPKNMVLQRYCAPVNNGGRLYFKKISEHQMLEEFFEEKTNEILHTKLVAPDPQAVDFIEQNAKYNKLSHSREKAIKNYYLLYGPNNALGITYDSASQTLSHPDLETPISVMLDSDVKPIYAPPEAQTTVDLSDQSAHRPSQIDKFNAKLAKTAAMNKDK